MRPLKIFDLQMPVNKELILAKGSREPMMVQNSILDKRDKKVSKWIWI
jgi:hypothetical protein